MNVTILDGGIGHLLKERGVQTRVSGTPFEQSFLSSAYANEDAADAVRAMHGDYISAGADVLTANNFALTPWSLARTGDGGRYQHLTELAARLVRAAAAEAPRRVDGNPRQIRVAGSLPPVGESYRVAGLPELELAQPVYAEIAQTLAPHVDLLLCETMASSTEAKYAASAANATGLPFWVAMTIEDSPAAVLRSGEPLLEAARGLAELPGLAAVLINCSAPQAITSAMPALRAAVPAEIEVGAYANGFRRTTSEWLSGSGASTSSSSSVINTPAEDYDTGGIILPRAYLSHAKQWVSAGATIVGGCCAIGPEHISVLAKTLSAKGAADAAEHGP